MLAVKHNARDGVMFGVTKSNQRRHYAAFCGKFLRRSRKNEKRFATRLFADVDIAPAHCFADAGAECFRDSFFCRKPGSQMARRKLHRHRVFDLAISEDAVEKPVAEAVD